MAWNFRELFNFNKSGITRNQITYSNYQYLVDKPAWLSLSNPSEFRQAVSDNPVLYGCIDILSSAASNGRKYLVDLNGKEISWTSRMNGVKQAKKLFVDEPNPLQSVKEMNYEETFMFFVYGNNYVYLNNPLESFDTDISNVITMICLPSEYVQVYQTGKIYDQINIEGIVTKYCLTNLNPIKEFPSKNIIHFNDINITNVGNSVIGSSRLTALKMPIENTQLAFEAMNVILKSRGMQGIIKMNNKDAQGTMLPIDPDMKKEVQDTFKSDYGLGKNQKQYLISYSDIDFIKTIMNSEELGIYKEFSNNSMIISNGFGIPPELYKTYMQGATFENQRQAERRLYQNTIIPWVDNRDRYYTTRLKMRDYGFELKTKWDHIDCLQEGRRDGAAATALNVSSANKAWNDNAITMNEYRKLIGMESIGTDGDKYKYEFATQSTNQIEPIIEQPAIE